MQQQLDTWYQWHNTCIDAVRYAKRQCVRWGDDWYGVFFVPKLNRYLVGRVNNYYGAKHIASVGPLGSIMRFI